MPLVGSSIALLRTEAAHKKENERKLKAHGQQSFRNDVLSRFSSKGDALNSREAAKWLSGMSSDGVITDAELHWILMLGNAHSTSDKRYQGCMKDMDIDTVMLYPDSFERVIQAWATYTQNRASIAKIFHQFDVDKNGTLSRSETTCFLQTFNNGIAPSEEDIDWVFQTWDVIGKGEGIETPELLYLINAWDERPSLKKLQEESAAEDQGPNAKAQEPSQNAKPTPSPQEGRSGTAVAVTPGPVCGQCLVQ
jgi:Ca2+-binding EF-hand superfamily protein